MLEDIEAQALAAIVKAADDAVTKLAASAEPAIVALAEKIAAEVRSLLTGNLTPDQYAQLEALWQADIDESAKNMTAGETAADPNAEPPAPAAPSSE